MLLGIKKQRSRETCIKFQAFKNEHGYIASRETTTCQINTFDDFKSLVCERIWKYKDGELTNPFEDMPNPLYDMKLYDGYIYQYQSVKNKISAVAHNGQNIGHNVNRILSHHDLTDPRSVESASTR